MLLVTDVEWFVTLVTLTTGLQQQTYHTPVIAIMPLGVRQARLVLLASNVVTVILLELQKRFTDIATRQNGITIDK
tara:strand:- start:224 stop:451 length:228 start_codon:yes stop_codon:yes gene_type:complete